MKTIYLTPNVKKDQELKFTQELIQAVGSRARLLMDEQFSACGLSGVTYCTQSEALSQADVVFALGGDGTLLSAAHIVLETGQPILGFNLGHLGFLAEVEKKDLSDSLDKFFAGEYIVEERMMLRALVQNTKTKTMKFLDALNDIVVSRATASRLLDVEIYVDDEFVDDYKADGMIVATPTGSTAYSMSAGGPIVDPSMASMVITPICPHKIYSKTILVPAQKTITAKMGSRSICGAIVSADGRYSLEFNENTLLTITKSPYVTKLLHINGNRFYSVLRQKLAGKDN